MQKRWEETLLTCIDGLEATEDHIEAELSCGRHSEARQFAPARGSERR